MALGGDHIFVNSQDDKLRWLTGAFWYAIGTPGLTGEAEKTASSTKLKDDVKNDRGEMAEWPKAIAC
jgi:hypothetical protein